MVLAGGTSSRMGQDKARLAYGPEPQLKAAFDLLKRHVQDCWIAVRPDQQEEPLRAMFPQVVDVQPGIGPAAGLLAAHAAFPDAAWLVLACDLPRLTDRALATLIAARDASHQAVAFRSPVDGHADPLCAIWEPEALRQLAAQVRQGQAGLRRALSVVAVHLLEPPCDHALDNANTPAEHAHLKTRLATGHE